VKGPRPAAPRTLNTNPLSSRHHGRAPFPMRPTLSGEKYVDCFHVEGVGHGVTPFCIVAPCMIAPDGTDWASSAGVAVEGAVDRRGRSLRGMSGRLLVRWSVTW
jgi:hypothetical protein